MKPTTWKGQLVAVARGVLDPVYADQLDKLDLRAALVCRELDLDPENDNTMAEVYWTLVAAGQGDDGTPEKLGTIADIMRAYRVDYRAAWRILDSFERATQTDLLVPSEQSEDKEQP